MKRLFLVFIPFVLFGCSTTQNALNKTEQSVRQAIAVKLDLSSKGIDLAIAELCVIASKGALDEKFGVNTEIAKDYENFCNRAKGFIKLDVKTK